MKKTYIAPLVRETKLTGHQMTATSVTGVSGTAGIGLGSGPTPGSADSKFSGDWSNIWGQQQ